MGILGFGKISGVMAQIFIRWEELLPNNSSEFMELWVPIFWANEIPIYQIPIFIAKAFLRSIILQLPKKLVIISNWYRLWSSDAKICFLQ